MKKFILDLDGVGEGCDYTIGCNNSRHIIAAETMEAAEQEAIKLLGEDWYGDLHGIGDYKIAEAVLYEVADEKRIDLDELRTAAAEEDQAEAEKKKEAEERAKLEELKAKYG